MQPIGSRAECEGGGCLGGENGCTSGPNTFDALHASWIFVLLKTVAAPPPPPGGSTTSGSLPKSLSAQLAAIVAPWLYHPWQAEGSAAGASAP